MIWLTFIIPVVTCLVLFFRFRRQTVWWEYFAVFIPSVIASFLTERIIVRSGADDTEYLGSYTVAVQHYDDWDQWVQSTCTDADGEDYDCSYRLYHDEYWVAIQNTGEEKPITRDDYQRIVTLWGTPEAFIDMHRLYYTKDGDAQRYDWDGNSLHAVTYTDPNSYENRTQVSSSLYRFSEVTEAEVTEFGLVDYPKSYHMDCFGVNREDHRPILGADVPEEAQRLFQYINGYYGHSHQFRIYICLFPDKSVAAADKQRDLWQGGNKNELVLCIGTDSTVTRTNWASTFSWCDDISLETALKQHLAGTDTLDFKELAAQVEQGLKSGLWHRKSFKDFKYIKVDMTFPQYLLFIFFILVVNLYLSVLVVENDFKND